MTTQIALVHRDRAPDQVSPDAPVIHLAGHPTGHVNRLPATTAVVRQTAHHVAAMLTAAALSVAQLIVIEVWGARRGATLYDLLMKWDAAWLTGISEHGYLRVPGRDPFESVAFFPGYPTLVRMVASPMEIFGVHDATFVAALIVSMSCSLLMACGITCLVVDLGQWLRGQRLGTSARIGVTVAATAVVFGAPMSVMYSMPYSEAMFTALALWALVMLLRRRYLVAGALVMVAGLTRLTAVALVITLVLAALVELWRYYRDHNRFPWAAIASPVIGAAGLVAYLAWASDETRSAGGYFAVQDKGWGSAFDWGASTWDWLRHNTIPESPDATSVGYTIAAWSMILTAALCVATAWPLRRGRLPWQIWFTATLAAGVVLGSGGTMHARPRLLLFATLLLLVPVVVLTIDRIARRDDWRLPAAVAALTTAIALWCCVGFWVSGHMLIEFQYGI